MKIQLIRNATLRIQYAGQQLLIDPYLADKFSRPSYTGASPNPLVELPIPPQEVIAGVDAVIVSHLHSDHFDPAARDLLPKDLPLFCQPEDQAKLASSGFTHLIPLESTLQWKGIHITPTPCQHGSGKVLEEMGKASGFVLRAAGEPTLYFAGDTLWFDGIAGAIAQHRPEVILTDSSGAIWGDHVLIVMDALQTVAVCKAAPNSTVVAVHMEALDHGTTSRAALRETARANSIRDEQLLIPMDGDTLEF